MKKTDRETVGWTLVGGAAALGLYLLLRPEAHRPTAMVPTVDPRFGQSFLRPPVLSFWERSRPAP